MGGGKGFVRSIYFITNLDSVTFKFSFIDLRLLKAVLVIVYRLILMDGVILNDRWLY